MKVDPEIVGTETEAITTEIEAYRETAAMVAQLRTRYEATIWVVDTRELMTAAKKNLRELVSMRTGLEGIRVEEKAPALARCKAIDADARSLTAEIVALETPLRSAIKEVEDVEKKEKEAARVAEENRVTKHRSRIADMVSTPVDMFESTPDEIREAADELKAIDTSHMEEFTAEATEARDKAVSKLRGMYTAAKQRADEQGRIDEERAELDRQRAEQDEKDKIKKITELAEEATRRRGVLEEERKRRAKIEDDEKVARDRIEEEKRVARKKEAEARAKIEDDEKSARDRIAEEDRVAREARGKADTEARELRERHEEKLKAEQEKIDAARKVEEDRKREEQEKAEEEARAEQRKADELLDGREMLRSFMNRFRSIDEFAIVVQAINLYHESAES